MDKLDEASILGCLQTAHLGRPLLYYPRLTSTMDVARQLARNGASEGTLVLAESQTAGRGRRGRSWFSPQGSLAFSLVLHPTLPQLPSLIMVASLAVVKAIESLAPLQAQIKWPNDVQVSGKKVCGILIESELKGGGVDFAILGIGLNVNVPLESFPPLPNPATSLYAALGREIPRQEVLCRLLAELESLYLDVRAGKTFLEEWQHRLVTLGQPVQVEADGHSLEGVAEGVEADGSLLLRQTDGQLRRIVAGDVTLLA